jgi:hypothetical protein
MYDPITLTRHLNNVGISPADRTSAGEFNVWGNSFPAEHLPSARRVTVYGVPFEFPDSSRSVPDNIRCAGQFIDVPPGQYDWIYLLAAAERRAEDELALHFADGQVDFEALRISDFWNAPPAFGERQAYACPVMHYPHHVQPAVAAMLWQQRIPVTRRDILTGLRMPRNVAIHVFAVTLYASLDSAREARSGSAR